MRSRGSRPSTWFPFCRENLQQGMIRIALLEKVLGSVRPWREAREPCRLNTNMAGIIFSYPFSWKSRVSFSFTVSKKTE